MRTCILTDDNMETADDCTQHEHERVERHNYIVAAYDVDLAYGGSEEGGWWYDTGSLVRVVRVERTEERAYAYCRRLNTRLQSKTFGPNQGRHDKSSVLSTGFVEAHVYKDTAPQGFPETRPHYE